MFHYKTGAPNLSDKERVNETNTERYSPEKKPLEISDVRISRIIKD